MNDAGRIGFVLKGDYNPATTYEMLDVVHYGHNSYAAKQTTTGNLPTNTTYWQPITDGEFITATDYATASTAGLVKPDGSTMVVGSNGVISSKGGTIAATVNPSGTQYAANWLMVNGTVITPEADKLYRVTISGNEMLYFWSGTEYEVISGGSAAGVSSFNSRTGAVTPTAGDYTPDQVGAMGLAGEILIDGSTNLPYDFNSYNGSKAGNYYRLSSTSMSNAPTGMSEKQFKMIVEQLKDSHDLNQQCKQTVIFSGFDEDTDAKEFYRYLKMVFVENGGVQSGNLEWSAWKEQGEGGVKSFNGRQGVVMPQSGDYTAAQVGAIASTDKGANGGVAELSNSGKVPVSQLPAMVGASGSTAGTAGAVPAPAAGDQNKVLSGGGLWVPQPTDMISDAWTTGKLYKVGEYCISNNTLYKCNTEHASAEGYAPPYSYWDDVTVGEELSSLNSGLTNYHMIYVLCGTSQLTSVEYLREDGQTWATCDYSVTLNEYSQKMYFCPVVSKMRITMALGAYKWIAYPNTNVSFGTGTTATITIPNYARSTFAIVLAKSDYNGGYYYIYAKNQDDNWIQTSAANYVISS